MNTKIYQRGLSVWIVKNLTGALYHAVGKGFEIGASEVLSSSIIERLSTEACDYSEFEITEIAAISLAMIATRKASSSSSHKYLIAYDIAASFRKKCKMYGMFPVQKEVTSDPNAPFCADKKQKKSLLGHMSIGFRTITSMLRIHKS